MLVDGMTYDVFVREMLKALSPLWPNCSNLAAAFSGNEETDKDAAIIYGKNAEYLSNLGMSMASVWGVDARHYCLEYTIVRQVPMLKHSAYARNINRWMNTGTLPRKRAARADVVLVAVCWLFAWGSEGREVARRNVQECFCVDDSDAADPLSMASALYLRSLEAYGNSLKARRTV